MAKYHIFEIQVKKADYRSLVSPQMMARFHMNYTQFVNSFRISEAMTLLVDKRYQDLTIREVGDMVGFANRQSFYASFFRSRGITPRQYRLKNLEMHPSMVARKKARV